MKPFHTLRSIAAPMPAENIDTDQIIPARFLKYSRADGYGGFLFHDQRFDREGGTKPGFVLNRPEHQEAEIIVAGPNFGNGSSREGAVYALADYGIRCVVAPSFGHIFYNNCFKNGVLPAKVAPADVERMIAAARADPPLKLTVDLVETRIEMADGAAFAFEVEPFFREMLLKGVDEIGLTMGHADAIAEFEAGYFDRFAFLRPAARA